MPFIGKRFKPDEADGCAEWIAARNNERQQIWYRAAAIKSGIDAAHAKDADVHGVYFVWVDLDPIKIKGLYEDRERDRAIIREMLSTKIPANVHAPSWIVDSGNGFQAGWMFKNPLRIGTDISLKSIAAMNNCLIHKFAGVKREYADDCFAPNHLLRLPFTINWKTQTQATLIAPEGATNEIV
jgi:hypothetical protein